MYADSRKIHIIEAVLKADDEKILSKMEEVIKQSAIPIKKLLAKDFVGRWAAKDGEAIEKAIEEGCEQINADDWN